MRISELARRSGLAPSTLRYYHERGLLHAERSTAGYRRFDDTALERLRFVGAGKRLGLALSEIGELLEVWQHGACAEVKASLRPRLADRVARAEQRRAEIAALAATLQGALEHLDRLPDRPEPCGPECELLELPSDPDTAGVPAAREAAERGAAVAQPPIPLEALRTAQPRRRTMPDCALEPEPMRQRLAQWGELLGDAPREEIPGGIGVTLPADRAAAAAGLAAAEQHCCGFFSFTLHLAGDVVRLEIRAPDDAREHLSRLVEPAAVGG